MTLTVFKKSKQRPSFSELFVQSKGTMRQFGRFFYLLNYSPALG